MILVDANPIVYGYVAHFSQHDAARDWLDEQLNGTVRIGLPWPAARICWQASAFGLRAGRGRALER
jgi:predicted nucleic acid-binding protein